MYEDLLRRVLRSCLIHNNDYQQLYQTCSPYKQPQLFNPNLLPRQLNTCHNHIFTNARLFLLTVGLFNSTSQIHIIV